MIKGKKTEINRLYLGLILLGLLALAVLLVMTTTGVGSEIRAILFPNIESWFG